MSAVAAAVVPALPALAGPPFVTDDAEPTDAGHWEIYNFVSAVHKPGETQASGGIDINYGAAKDLQLTAVFPVEFDSDSPSGLGNIELAAKLKILHQKDGAWTPDLAVFPRIFLPAASSRFGSRRLNLLLPLWAQKDWGKWSLFGGGGYQINPGPGARNYWVGGVTLQRRLSERLSIGAEIYHQTADAKDAKDFTGLNLGAVYKLSDRWSLLAAAGPGVQHARDEGQYDVYAALEATY